MRFLLAALALCLLLAPQGVCAWETYIGKNMTVRVVSPPTGNVITVKDSDGKEFAIRLYGIGIPTTRQPMGEEARALLGQILAPGVKVILTTVNQDEDGVVNALAQVQDRSVNNRLVAEGLAWVDRSTCKAFFCRRWHIEEHLAQKDRRGLWGLNITTPPWQWGEMERREARQ